MDGNKKIIKIVYAAIVALSMAACTVKPPGYVSLYLDNSRSVNDTVKSLEMQASLSDNKVPYIFDATNNFEPELPVLMRVAEEKSKVSLDSVYHHEITELIEAISDSIQILQLQMIELHQHANEDLFEMQDTGYLKTDTGYVNKKTTISPAVESQQHNLLTLQLIRAREEQIQMMQNQLNALQNEVGRTPQRTHIIRGSDQLKPMGSQQPDYSTRQLLKSMDEQIQMLQNQLNAMQASVGRIPRQTPITKEPEHAQPLDSQQLQARNDTIQFLRSHLYDLQIPPPPKDAIYKEKEPQKTQAVNDPEVDQKTSELFQGLQDTLLLLKTRILTMEEQILQDKDTQAREKQDEMDVFYETKTDTTLLIAYYELGEIKPLEEESILRQLEVLFDDKNVTKITLSGFTDSSGSEVINKEITTLRLNYLSDLIIPRIPKEKVFFQNFGDAFASDMVISNERRIEIRIHIK